MIEPYNYNDEPSGRSETLVQALEKCERLEKQLKIAVSTLQAYAKKNMWDDAKTPDDDFYKIHPKCAWYVNGYEPAQTALKAIEELEK